MEFGFPGFLWALPFAALPLILHLFFRRKKRTVDFSSLQFFIREERNLAFRKRLREILLLFLRVFAFLCIILALSRPSVRGIRSAGGGAEDTVIALDDTMSMQRRTPSGISALEAAKRSAEEIVSSIPARGRCGVVLFSGKPGLPLTGERKKVLDFLRSVTATGCGGTLTGTIGRSLAELSRTGGEREIVVISDFQRTMMPRRPVVSDSSVRVILLPVPGKRTDLSLRPASDPSGKNAPPGKEIVLPLVLRSCGYDRPVMASVALKRGKTVLERKSAEVPPGEPVHLSFTHTAGPAGRETLSAVVEDEDISLDNTVFFTFPVSGGSPVLLVRGDEEPDPYYYFRKAVSPDGERAAFCFRTAVMSEFASGRDPLPGIVFFSPGRSVSRPAATRLLAFVRGGGTLFLFPGKDGDKRFADLLSEMSSGELPEMMTGKKHPSGQGLVLDGPLSGLNPLLQLDRIRWKTAWKIVSSDSAVTLARSGKEPFIVMFPCGRGKVIVAASRFDRSSSNWPALKSFPVVMNRLMKFIAGDRRTLPLLNCGAGCRIMDQGPLAWTDGQGKRHRSETGSYPGSFLPGIAFFENAPVDCAISLPPPEESDLETVPSAELAGKFRPSPSVLDPAQDIVEQLLALRKGTDCTGLLGGLALLFLVLEYLLGAGLGWKGRKS